VPLSQYHVYGAYSTRSARAVAPVVTACEQNLVLEHISERIGHLEANDNGATERFPFDEAF
jgi:hypothetical protein